MYWHLTIASRGRLNLFPTRVEQVQTVRALLRYQAEILLFSAVDDHLHVVVGGPRPGRLGGDLLRHLSTHAEVAPAYIKAVAERRHLYTLVDYVLRQPRKHGLSTPAHLWEGSCFLDLVEARSVGFDLLPLHRALPRLRTRELLEPVGLRRLPEPLDLSQLAPLGIRRLHHAVRVAAGLPSLTQTRVPEVVRARRTLAWMAHQAGFSAAMLAAELDTTERSARRLRSWEPAGELVDGACLYLALEEPG